MKLTVTNVKSSRQYDSCVYSTVNAFFAPIGGVTTPALQVVQCDVRSHAPVSPATDIEGVFSFETREYDGRSFLRLTFLERPERRDDTPADSTSPLHSASSAATSAATSTATPNHPVPCSLPTL